MKLRDGLKSVLNCCKSLSDIAGLTYDKNITHMEVINGESLSRIRFVILTHRIGSQEAADLIALAGDLSMEGISVEAMMDNLKSLSRVERYH